MSLRLEYRDIAPGAVRALAGLNAYSERSSIPQRLRRLIETRVSQINGCSYCVATHWQQCLDLGEEAARMESLATWRNSLRFTEAERAALAWAESITLIAERRAPDPEYAQIQAHFSDVETIDVTFVALSMNAWNRLAIAFGREAGASSENAIPNQRTAE
jgi:AhpD family alkylhydroperoxidase